MSLDQSPIVELEGWLDSPCGQYVKAWEQKQVDGMVANVFGYRAVQIGLPSWDLLSANRMPYKDYTHVVAGSTPSCERLSLVTDPENLPFESQSIDLLMLPHVLECSTNPHQILREAERVLIPEGRVVISGFNPWSLWGGRVRMPGLEPLMPVAAHLQVSLPRLKDWFKLLSFEADRGRFGCYAPPCLTEKWLQRWAFMDSAGDRWWPVCGAVYVVSAVKRVIGLRVIGPQWKRKTKHVRQQSVVTGRHAGF
ncbi:MAG: class I SAM-dependent methyltransferase [Paralcaligenes sp.]